MFQAHLARNEWSDYTAYNRKNRIILTPSPRSMICERSSNKGSNDGSNTKTSTDNALIFTTISEGYEIWHDDHYTTYHTTTAIKQKEHGYISNPFDMAFFCFKAHSTYAPMPCTAITMVHYVNDCFVCTTFIPISTSITAYLPRKTINIVILCAAPDTILPIKKTLTPNKKTGFRPKMSANLPYKGWKHVFVSIYATPTFNKIHVRWWKKKIHILFPSFKMAQTYPSNLVRRIEFWRNSR